MCAYNPGVTDISGQLRAQGMMAGSQAIAQGIGNAFQEYKANEEKRRLANAATRGILAANPDALQGILQDPELAKLWGKKQSGKSSLSDDLQFAGALTTYGQAKQERTAQQFREMQLKREQDVEQRRADAFKALKEADANGYQGIDAQEAEVMKEVLGISQMTGKLPDPETMASMIRYRKELAQRADEKQALLEMKQNTAGVTTINGKDFIQQPNGTLVQVREPAPPKEKEADPYPDMKVGQSLQIPNSNNQILVKTAPGKYVVRDTNGGNSLAALLMGRAPAPAQPAAAPAVPGMPAFDPNAVQVGGPK